MNQPLFTFSYIINHHISLEKSYCPWSHAVMSSDHYVDIAVLQFETVTLLHFHPHLNKPCGCDPGNCCFCNSVISSLDHTRTTPQTLRLFNGLGGKKFNRAYGYFLMFLPIVGHPRAHLITLLHIWDTVEGAYSCRRLSIILSPKVKMLFKTIIQLNNAEYDNCKSFLT